MKLKSIYLLLFILICFCIPVISLAQGPLPDPPVDTPIDGGLSILIATGVGYGYKKYRANRKIKIKEEREEG